MGALAWIGRHPRHPGGIPEEPLEFHHIAREVLISAGITAQRVEGTAIGARRPPEP